MSNFLKVGQNLVGLVLFTIGISQAFAQNPIILGEKREEIFPKQSLHVHGSSLIALANGDVLAVWFQGSGERTADDVVLMGSRKRKTSAAWSAPFLMADTPGIPDCNPVLFLNGKDELFLVWIAVLGNRWEHSVLRMRRSLDYQGEGAPNWHWQDNIFLKPGDEFVEEVKAKFKELPDRDLAWAEYAPAYERMIMEASTDSKKRSIGWMTRIKPLVENNRIILPLYSDGFNFSLMAISEDHGNTWTPSKPLVGKGAIQPALARKKNGELVAMLRDSGDGPARIQQSISHDNGISWSAAQKTDFPNTASVELLSLKDGRWWMVGNDISDGRYRLALWISSDEGITWSAPQYLENDPSKTGSFSYPSLIQDASGKVHLSYSSNLPSGKTIQYIQLDPKKIN
jgi:predicted neuraminidase